MLQRLSKATVLLALLACSSCVDDNTSFYISAHLSGTRSTSTSGSGCTYSASNAPYLSGLYDPAYGGAYVLHPLYNNALQNRATALATDPNGVFVSSAVVEILTFDGQTIAFASGPNPFEVPTSTFVPSSTSTGTVSKAAGAIVVIPATYGAELAGSGLDGVTVAVRAIGKTNGQTNIETDDFYWQIFFADLTAQCGTTASTPCNVGQDQVQVIVCCSTDADCDDTNECTTDMCDTAVGCSNTNVLDGTSCNSGMGTCMSGVCM